jgi:hypothetical protein
MRPHSLILKDAEAATLPRQSQRLTNPEIDVGHISRLTIVL